MADIISFDNPSHPDEQTAARDRLRFEEGLAMLHVFRSIKNRAVRRGIFDMTRALATEDIARRNKLLD
jgi:hypothetical protein